MMLTLRTLRARKAISGYWRQGLTLLLFIAVVVTIARSYVGESSSPYGVCYGLKGRSIPCELAKQR